MLIVLLLNLTAPSQEKEVVEPEPTQEPSCYDLSVDEEGNWNGLGGS